MLPFPFDHLSEGWSAISASLYLAYINFFAYVTWSVRRMDAVHSRLGVTFSALVEITFSTITSLSVCALVVFNVTMVPWEVKSYRSYFIIISKGTPSHRNCARWRREHVQFGRLNNYSYLHLLHFRLPMLNIDSFLMAGGCSWKDLCCAFSQAAYR